MTPVCRCYLYIKMPPSQAAQQPLIVCPKCKTQPTWDGGRQGWGQGPFRVGGCTFGTGQGTGGTWACKKCNHRWKETEDTDNKWRAEMKRLRAKATAAPASSAADGAAATFTWQGNNNGFGTVAAGKPSLLQQEHIRAGDAALVAPPYCVRSELCEVAEGDEIWAEFKQDQPPLWYKGIAGCAREQSLGIVFTADGIHTMARTRD